MPIQREYLSPNEIAEYLGVSPFTIRRYIKLGELRAVKLLGGFRVHRNDLQGFLKAHLVNPAEEELDTDEVADDSAKSASPTPSRPTPSPDTPSPPTPLPEGEGRSRLAPPAPSPVQSGVPQISIPQNPPRRPRGRPRKNPR